MSDFNAAFLEEALEEQKKELQRLSEAVVVLLSPADEEAEPNTLVPKDPRLLRMPTFLGLMYFVFCLWWMMFSRTCDG